MTQGDRDDLEDLIRRVIAEDRAEQIAHPGQRARITQFTDAEGKTWISRTRTKIEDFKSIFWLVSLIVAMFAGAGATYYKYVMLPDYTAHTAAMIAEHSRQARGRMDEVAKNIVTRAEFNTMLGQSAWAADKERRWQAQEEINKRVFDEVAEMRRDVKELLRRR